MRTQCLIFLFFIGLFEAHSFAEVQLNDINEREAIEREVSRIVDEFSQTRFSYFGSSFERIQSYLDNYSGHNELEDEIFLYGEHESLVPLNHYFMQYLVDRLTGHLQHPLQKLFVLNTFVQWRMTHVAHFYEDRNPHYFEEAIRTKKGQYFSCALSQRDSGKLFFEDCGIELPFPSIARSRTLAALATGVDNCYGYAYLFLTMSRLVGIPARMLKEPHTLDSAHFWVQVKIGDQWYLVDPTFNDSTDVGIYTDNSDMEIGLTFFLRSHEEIMSYGYEVHRTFDIVRI